MVGVRVAWNIGINAHKQTSQLQLAAEIGHEMLVWSIASSLGGSLPSMHAMRHFF